MSEPIVKVDKFEGAIVVEQSFSILFRDIVLTWLVSFVVLSPPFVALLFWQVHDYPALFAFVISPFFSYFLTALLSYRINQKLKTGRPAGFLQSARRGVRAIIPVISIAFVTGVIWGAMTVGALALFFFALMESKQGDSSFGGLAAISIPAVLILGFYLSSLLWFAIPAAVLEGHILSSYGRSILFTRSYRGLVLIFLALFIIMNAIAQFIPQLANFGHSASVAISWVATALVMALSTIMINVSYYRLCQIKDGTQGSGQQAVKD